jgi:tripartite-type tricarboxylate transporter receptor subunit TctC
MVPDRSARTCPGLQPKDFVAWVKTQGDKANFAHGGIGTNSHLCAVMMGNVLGFKPTIVAYRGSGPAIGDMLAGQIDLLWDQVTNALPQIQAWNVARHRHHLARSGSSS